MCVCVYVCVHIGVGFCACLYLSMWVCVSLFTYFSCNFSECRNDVQIFATATQCVTENSSGGAYLCLHFSVCVCVREGERVCLCACN
jgi:hypothetical protein